MFRRPHIPERKPIVYRPISGGTVVRVSGLVVATVKFQYLRSKARLIACRLLPCQNCGKEDGTVVAAHSNQAKHGKGRSIKASDEFIAALCATCHYDIDQGSRLSQAEREKLWDEAYMKTKRELEC